MLSKFTFVNFKLGPGLNSPQQTDHTPPQWRKPQPQKLFASIPIHNKSAWINPSTHVINVLLYGLV